MRPVCVGDLEQAPVGLADLAEVEDGGGQGGLWGAEPVEEGGEGFGDFLGVQGFVGEVEQDGEREDPIGDGGHGRWRGVGCERGGAEVDASWVGWGLEGRWVGEGCGGEGGYLRR